MRCICRALAFECCPGGTIQNQKVRMPLYLVWIEMNHYTAGKAFFQFFRQSLFEFVFEHDKNLQNKRNSAFKPRSIPPIKGHVFIASVFTNFCKILLIFGQKKSPCVF
nr:MAG TPA: hypothetical protein [Caudoviricetes sp.]